MRYAKPELKVLNNALNMVRGICKGSPFVRDNAVPHLDNATTLAYEADE